MSASLDKLKKDIAAENFARLYIFHGEESYLRDYYLKELEKKIAGSMADFNLCRFDGDTVTADALRQALDSLPFGTPKKLVIVHDYPLFGKGELKDELPNILADISEHICLVFVFDALEYKPDKRLSLYKTIEKAGEIIEFSKAGDSELIGWLKRRFAALSKNISTADCEKMLFICGGLMTNLVTEVEKITSGTSGDTVTAADIERLASRSIEAGVFDLTDAISDGKYSRALDILSDLLALKTDPVSICALLVKQMRRLYGAKLGMLKKSSLDDITKALGYNSSYPAKLAMRTAERFSLSKLRFAQKLCLETDIALKSNNADAKRTLEMFIMRLAV